MAARLLVKEQLITEVGVDYLRRYQAGEYSVWDELVKLAPQIVGSETMLAEAASVADEIMVRVSKNVSILRRTLMSAGASLGQEGKPLVAGDLKYLTEKFGRLPISLDAFYRNIGSVSLRPAAGCDYGKLSLEGADEIRLIALDPLEINSASDFTWLLEEYEERDEECPFELYLCPDFLHKQDYSGGEPYSVELTARSPEEKLDPLVKWERHSLSFVNYLRYCFRWGGFPGLDVHETKDADIDDNWRMGFERAGSQWRVAYQRLLNKLQQGLIEF